MHLPDLQRGFVWDDGRVRMLFDSLYRLYPVGSLLLWKPVWETEEAPINVRPWDLFPPNATTGNGEPEAYVPPQPGAVFVLDGQQRLTSLFRVIFASRRPSYSTREPNLYVSLSRDAEWADEPFVYVKSRHVKKEDERRALLVPAEVLFAACVLVQETARRVLRSARRSASGSSRMSTSSMLRWIAPTRSGTRSSTQRSSLMRSTPRLKTKDVIEISVG